MANPRDLAEQAFALLQSALSDSEARASDLDEQLKRKRAPKNRLEEQLDVLTHRLENVEAERTRWEQQAGHLEEVAEAERTKVAQLKKKLEIAESGPEKLTKKEINFWRAKAEGIDEQVKEYQERLAALRRELNERETEVEKLRAAAPADARVAPSAEAEAEAEAEADDELRRQLEQRDRWLAELRLELHELRAQPAPPLETQAEVETLRSQIASLEHALAEAHNLRAAVAADLGRSRQELATHERAVREAAAEGERARTTLTEREHRIVELSAEVEHLRNDLRQREEREHAHSAGHAEQVAALTRDLETLRGRCEQQDHDAGAARADFERTLHEREQQIEMQRERLAAHDRELADLRSRIDEREQAVAHERRQAEEQRNALDARQRELEDRERELREVRQALAERDERLAALGGELEQAELALKALRDEQNGLRDALQNTHHELEQARATLAANEREQKSLRETLSGSSRELDELRSSKQRLERSAAEAAANADDAHTRAVEADGRAEQAESRAAEADVRAAEADARVEEVELKLAETAARLADAAARADEAAARADESAARAAEAAARATTLEQDLEAAREQMAGLEGELKEEREHAESLSELANERREHMTKLQEQVEEAEERYAEANWRLGKALYFEKLVKRRKGLIAKLLEALRAKMKTNTALKAGLDGLRTYKQTAEMNQHKLLQRIDALKAELEEAEETVKRHQGGTAAKEELTSAIARATALEQRLNTQAEIIQALEADLKTARLAHKPGDEQQDQVERLTKELEAKSAIIEKLQADTDEQQRKLAKLRGSESETLRLKALTEKDRSEIDALQREVTQLREALTRQNDGAPAAQASGNNAELEAKLKERENSVTRLMGTIKEHEATIKTLTESADSWKRKYQFLATDQPDAYKSSTEK